MIYIKINAEEHLEAGCQWLMPIILATQEAESKRINPSQPRQVVHENLS
jgi:hypothetical protein